MTTAYIVHSEDLTYDPYLASAAQSLGVMPETIKMSEAPADLEWRLRDAEAGLRTSETGINIPPPQHFIIGFKKYFGWTPAPLLQSPDSPVFAVSTILLHQHQPHPLVSMVAWAYQAAQYLTGRRNHSKTAEPLRSRNAGLKGQPPREPRMTRVDCV